MIAILSVTILALSLAAPVAAAHPSTGDSRHDRGGLTPPASIQAALNGAPAGSTVQLGPGTFVEQLLINNSITIDGAGAGQTIIQSPAVLIPDYLGVGHVVTIGNGSQVRIEGVTVEASLQCEAAPFSDGGAIGVGGNASLNLEDSLVTTFGPTAAVGSACTVAGVSGLEIIGDGIDIGFRGAPHSAGVAAWQLHGHAVLNHDSFFGFGDASNGPAISVGDRSGSGSSAILDHDSVLAPPRGLHFFMPDSFHSEVLVAGGATAAVTHSSIVGGSGTFYGLFLFGAGPSVVQDNVIGNITCEGFPPAFLGGFCGPDIFSSIQYSGILALAAHPGTVITENLIFDTDSGIYLYFSTGCCDVRSNQIVHSLQYAFEIQDSVFTLSENEIDGAPYEVGVGADVLSSSVVLVDSEAHGISVGPAFTEAASGLTATATFLSEDD